MTKQPSNNVDTVTEAKSKKQWTAITQRETPTVCD